MLAVVSNEARSGFKQSPIKPDPGGGLRPFFLAREALVFTWRLRVDPFVFFPSTSVMNPMKSGEMSVLISIPTRFRVVLIGVACLGISLISQAQIVLNVSGGTGGTPLTINVTTGANFTATGNSSGGLYVVFDNFWNNEAANSLSSSATTATVQLNGSSTRSLTGSVATGNLSSNDLVLGFGSVTFSSGATVPLSTGSRVTNSLNLTYDTINANGNARITDGLSTTPLTGSSVTWTTVPEPGTYAAISGLVCLGGAIGRRRFKRS